ncbi:efflux RND transporter permease subunit [Peribacillus sp. NPDC058075]|uniref:efflux RND transporter permease subunit n=1 Tax=unclassified Peribacillus TaxID=2675266 RepID=UPI0036DA47DA
MNTFIEGTMKRSVLILTCVILLLVWGGLSAFQMQRDYLPPINNTTLMVTIQADQYQADQVKRNITAKVEEAVHSVDNLDNMEMNSFDGGLMGSFYFPSHTNMRKAENEVKAAVDQIRFPAGVNKPLITRVSTNSFPVMRLSLTGGSANINENKLRSSIQKKVATELKRVPGVREVKVTGGGNDGYILTLIPGALEKYGIKEKEIKKAFSSIHPIWPQGSIEQNNGSNRHVTLPIRVTDWAMNKRDLSNLKIPAKDGQKVPLKEVAKINKSMVNLKSVTRTKGEPSVLLEVLKTPSSNITDVTQRINERMEMIPEIKSKMVDFTVLLDQGKEIDSALHGLIKEGLLGIGFTVLCIFFFFRNIRSTLIVALSLPICLLTATTLLKAMGVSLNLLTISGLIVAMGRVVDDSIVVIDNMYRKQLDKVGGPLRLTQLANGVVEMIPAIVSSTATTVAVFIPISILGGMISSAFSGFAWAVVIALITSLAVSILVVPALAHLLWSKRDSRKVPEIESRALTILHWSFHKRKWVMSAALVLLSITILVAVFLPVNFFPRGNSKDVAIQIELPEDSQLSDVDAEVKNVESILKNNIRVDTYSSTLGSTFTPMFDDVFDEGGGWMQKQNIANISIGIKTQTDPDVFIKKLRQQLTLLSTSAVYTVSNQAIAGDDSRLKVILTGADHHELNKAAILVRSKLQMIPGLGVEGTASDSDESIKYQLSLNQDKIEQLGINIDDVLTRIHYYLPQEDKMTLSAGDMKLPVAIHSSGIGIPLQTNDPDPQKTILSKIGHEMFTAKDGSKVSLAEITTLKMDTQAVISEKDGRPFTTVTGNIVTKDIGKVTKQVKETMNNLDLPAGMEYSVGGISKQMKQMIAEMGAALSLSVLLVLMIVSAVFRGWHAPVAVMICVPLALIGSVWSMVIFRLEWNLAALIGMLMLGGIVVTNGIVLVDKIERNLAEGLETKQAILKGTATRVRPVIMTAGATIFTLLPLALSGGSNVLISKTLGAVVIGGMLSSTLISLLVIPIMYQWLLSKARKTKIDQRRKLPA